MRKAKYFALGAFLLLTVPFLVPVPMTVARQCTITVLDENRKPWPNAKVSRGWAFDSTETLEDKLTGPDGTATFDSRVQRHCLLVQNVAPVVDALIVHGSEHVTDEYLVTFPSNYTAEIDSDAAIKSVDDEGFYHFASVDLGSLPRDQCCQVKFILKKKPLAGPFMFPNGESH